MEDFGSIFPTHTFKMKTVVNANRKIDTFTDDPDYTNFTQLYIIPTVCALP